jgi:hypothetical protein
MSNYGKQFQGFIILAFHVFSRKLRKSNACSFYPEPGTGEETALGYEANWAGVFQNSMK